MLTAGSGLMLTARGCTTFSSVTDFIWVESHLQRFSHRTPRCRDAEERLAPSVVTSCFPVLIGPDVHPHRVSQCHATFLHFRRMTDSRPARRYTALLQAVGCWCIYGEFHPVRNFKCQRLIDEWEFGTSFYKSITAVPQIFEWDGLCSECWEVFQHPHLVRDVLTYSL